MLDQHPRFLNWVAKDLGLSACQPTGRLGLSADTFLLAGIVMKQHQMTFQELTIQLIDSSTFRAFCRIGLESPSSALRPGNRLIGAYLHLPLESPIHILTDSRLLDDGIRIMVRLLKRAIRYFPTILFCDRTRATKMH